MKSMKEKRIFLRNKKTIVPSGAQKTLECGVRDHEEADCLCPPHNLVITIIVYHHHHHCGKQPSLSCAFLRGGVFDCVGGEEDYHI